MYNISQREGERYFLRTLLLHKSGATSFGNLKFHEGVQHSTFYDTCYALGLLLDDAEWLRCMKDSFSSNLDCLRELFSIIMAFCEPSNPLRIWERIKELIISHFRRAHLGTVLDDELANHCVLTEISPSLNL